MCRRLCRSEQKRGTQTGYKHVFVEDIKAKLAEGLAFVLGLSLGCFLNS